jgi:hypothetical protein
MDPRQLMKDPNARWVKWAAWVPLPVVLVLIAIEVRYWMLAYEIDQSPDTLTLTVIVTITMFVFALFGGLIASHRPSNPIGWIFGGAAVAIALRGSTGAYAVWGLAFPEQSMPGRMVLAWFSNWIWRLPIGVLGTFLPLLFPDGRLLSRRWRIVAWLSAVVIFLSCLGTALGRPLDDYPELVNPLAAPEPFVGIFDVLAGALSFFPLVIGLSVASLIIRARRADPIEREQIKWIAYVGAVLVVGTALTLFTPLVDLWPFLIFLPLSAIPIASAIAIYRYRLFDIDRLISRTVSYALITVILGALFVLVALVPTILVGGDDSPDWLIAIGTLVIVAFFRPVRRRVQGAVDRRFNRARYNATQTIESFSARLRDEVDLDALGAELRSVVSRTMQPAHVSLWVKEES